MNEDAIDEAPEFLMTSVYIITLLLPYIITVSPSYISLSSTQKDATLKTIGRGAREITNKASSI